MLLEVLKPSLRKYQDDGVIFLDGQEDAEAAAGGLEYRDVCDGGAGSFCTVPVEDRERGLDAGTFSAGVIFQYAPGHGGVD